MANASIGAPRFSQRPRLSPSQLSVLQWLSGQGPSTHTEIKRGMIARGWIPEGSAWAPTTTLRSLAAKRLVFHDTTHDEWMITSSGIDAVESMNASSEAPA